MKIQNVLSSLMALAAVLPAQDVRYNFASGQNFSKLKTHSWAEKAPSDVDELTAQQIRSAIDNAMAKKGLALREKAPGDLMLSFQTSVDKEQSLTLYNSGFGIPRDWRRGGITTGQTSTIRVGELALDIYGLDSKQLLWRGVISDTIRPRQKPQQWHEQLEKDAAKLLKKFPPPSK